MPASNEIFFSYAWNDKTDQGDNREKIVDDLYDSLKKSGYQVVRDKYDLEYKGFISDFMTRIGEGKNIVVAISQKYLQSPYCMFELYEIARNSNFDKNVFSQKVMPLMLEFIDFSRPAVLDEYLAFWQTAFNKWTDLVKNRSDSLSAEQFQRFDKIKMVYQNFGKLADWLVDMNTLNPAMLSADNFETIKKALQKNSVDGTIEDVQPQPHQNAETALGDNKTKSAFKIAVAAGTLAVLIFAAFMVFPSKKSTPINPAQSVSVFVHGKKGRQDMILRKQGYVLMDIKGGERKKADINENGVAYFQNLHTGDSVQLEVDFSEPYKSICPDSLFVVTTDGRFYLQVTLQGIGSVKGVVLYNDAPLQGVTVSIDKRSDSTDANGRFEIKLPEAEQKQQYTVWFDKAGFKARSAPAYPQTGEDLNIVMEK